MMITMKAYCLSQGNTPSTSILPLLEHQSPRWPKSPRIWQYFTDMFQERWCVHQTSGILLLKEERRAPRWVSRVGHHSSEERVIYVDCLSLETTRAPPPAINPDLSRLTRSTGTDPAEVSGQSRRNIGIGGRWIWWLKWQPLTYKVWSVFSFTLTSRLFGPADAI